MSKKFFFFQIFFFFQKIFFFQNFFFQKIFFLQKKFFPKVYELKTCISLCQQKYQRNVLNELKTFQKLLVFLESCLKTTAASRLICVTWYSKYITFSSDLLVWVKNRESVWISILFLGCSFSYVLMNLFWCIIVIYKQRWMSSSCPTMYNYFSHKNSPKTQIVLLRILREHCGISDMSELFLLSTFNLIH